MTEKLTKAQRKLLDMISGVRFRTGLMVDGPREFRTATSLHRRGLAVLDVFDRITITPAGRAALTEGGET